jgi:predicted DNA binding CopG/RHH family protein
MIKNKKAKYLDAEERDLDKVLQSVDVKKLAKVKKETQVKFKSAAREFVKNETKMNIRIDPLQLKEIKKRAGKEGLKYQSFVKSVLHKYVTGQLIERKAV